MSLRTTWVLVACFFLIAIAVAVIYTGDPQLQVLVELSPREENGSQVAVDFVQDLARGRLEAAYERTAIAFQEELDYDRFAQQTAPYFAEATRVVIQPGDRPGNVSGRIDYRLRDSQHFAVEVINQGGFWFVRRLSFN